MPAPHDPSITLGKSILRANDLDYPTWWMGASTAILIAYVVAVNVVLNVALRLLNGECCACFGSQCSFRKEASVAMVGIVILSTQADELKHHGS